MKVDYFCLFFALIGISFAVPIDVEIQGGCEYGWSWAPVRQQCVRVQDTHLTQFVAEVDCQQYGAHLASITSAFEETEIMSITKDVGHCTYYWIGAKKIGTGPYVWTDGKPFSYSNFGPGPDSNPAFDCVDFQQYSTNWHTYDCNQKNCFVCAKPL
uniref:C-type lectin domain-containing protein n=1 Tax=Panagrolaimus sp. JU765 TaxID=591449 RepID=A0AC34Q9H6_9BILA